MSKGASSKAEASPTFESFHKARLMRGDLPEKPGATGRSHPKRGSLCDRSEQSKHSLQGPGSLVVSTDGEAGSLALSGEVQVRQGSEGDPWHSQA